MKEEQIQIAIAEACGAKWACIHSASHALLTFWDDRCGVPDWSYCKRVGLADDIPAYPQDLNACHEMEKVLTLDQWNKYASLIGRHDYRELLHATAPQRAEAFLKTIGKWVEDEG